MAWTDIATKIPDLLETIQSDMFNKAKAERLSRTKEVETWAEFMKEVNSKNLVLTQWCEKVSCEEQVKEKSKTESQAMENEGEETLTGSAKTLCIPVEQFPLKEGAKCFACNEPATKRALWGRSY